jgi:hypothetical protein
LSSFFCPSSGFPRGRSCPATASSNSCSASSNTTSGVAPFAHLDGLFGGWLDVQDFRGCGLFGKR